MKIVTILFSIVSLLFLAACGGGGLNSTRPDGSGSTSPSAVPNVDSSPSRSVGSAVTLSAGSASPPSIRSASPPSTANPDNVRKANARGVLASLVEVGNRYPRFGTAAQAGSGGITQSQFDDPASAVFDGTTLSLRLPTAGSALLELDTEEHSFATAAAASAVAEHIGRRWTLFHAGNRSTTLVSVTASWDRWDEGEPDDWLSAGSWLHFSGTQISLAFPEVEAGAFVHGPEFAANRVPVLPVEGGARYSGPARGLYSYRYGLTSQAPGKYEIGEYFGTATLATDFASQSIQGCIGCEGQITISGIGAGAGARGQDRFSNIPTSYKIHLGAADFSGATFRAGNVTVENANTDVATSEGWWGGRFSSIDNGAGEPRLVAGTAGATFTEADHSSGVFVGSYFGPNIFVPWLLQTSNQLLELAGGGPPMFLYGLGAHLEMLQQKETTDTLLLTDFNNRGSGANTNALDGICRETVCIATGSSYDLSDFEFGEAQYQAVMIDNGIDLAQLRQEEPDVDGKAAEQIPDTFGYGGWLDHSAFATLVGPMHLIRTPDGGDDGERVFGLSFGARSGSVPIRGSATWTGAMTGMDMVLDHPVQGDAVLGVDFAQMEIDVVFSKISDLETLSALTRPDLPLTSPSENFEMRWDGLSLSSTGGFGGRGQTIEGWFYGPSHVEVGGVFQQHGIVGAFGAKRQPR